MPLSTLESGAALIVIDLQKGLANLPFFSPIEDVIKRSAQLARAFRERGLPVVLVHVSGSPSGRTDTERAHSSPPPGFAELLPELEQQPGDLDVIKACPGAFIGTSLDTILRQRNVTQVFFTGIVTSQGVETSAREAFDYGYNVVLVTDAMTDRDADLHSHSIRKIFPRLGETELTANVLGLLRS